jgi:signal transduction histidine kinase
MSNNNVTIHFTSNEIQSNIIESNQITIFRIVQELINNSLKHSNCTEIVVDCSQNGELFLITVEDNGIGFNTNDIDSFAGLGLRNIKSRVELLKGTMDVVSNSWKGTVFNIELKVQFENEKKI